MPFNTALSGIRAANDDLRLTGNNIANASTTGFKKSRAEFGDVYSTTVLGSGLNQVGSGVQVQSFAQQFSQGNITFTENILDLAISGSGFFVTDLNGEREYTRAGTLGLDAIDRGGAGSGATTAARRLRSTGLPRDPALSHLDRLISYPAATCGPALSAL